uniref:Uncharacterized protein n=1 Tax=viral metagenome TaxID=1070528 RepID=A0A6C0IA60_9ZZZZ
MATRFIPFMVSKPYSVRMFDNNINIYRIALLLDNGTSVWTEDTKTDRLIQENHLIPNDIISFPLIKWQNTEGLTYIPVDPTRTNIKDFLQYEETQQVSSDAGLLWRTFYYFHEPIANKNFLESWNYPKEFIPYLDNALKVWNVINT